MTMVKFIPVLIFLVFIGVIVLQPLLLPGAEYKVIPQFSLREGHNDNIFFDSEDENKIHDWITVLSLP